jgi:hypothetical protein
VPGLQPDWSPFRDYPLIMLDPAQLPAAPAEAAGDKDRALQLGRLVHVGQIQPVDLPVTDGAAVNKSGARAADSPLSRSGCSPTRA